MTLPVLIGIGLVLNAAAALVVLRRGSLDPGGAAASVIVGTLIIVCGGPLFWFVLMAFFVSSTAMGYVGRDKKEPLKKIHQKGGRRDMFQVLANGGVGALCALSYKLTGNPAWAIGFAVSFASSNSDTWASELGVLSRRRAGLPCHLSARHAGSLRRSEHPGKCDGRRRCAFHCSFVCAGKLLPGSRAKRVPSDHGLCGCGRVRRVTFGQLPGGDGSGSICNA